MIYTDQLTTFYIQKTTSCEASRSSIPDVKIMTGGVGGGGEGAIKNCIKDILKYTLLHLNS